MSNKKSLLDSLLEAEQLYKQAQITGSEPTVEPEVDPVAADKMAQDIFDKLFDDELRNLISQL